MKKMYDCSQTSEQFTNKISFIEHSKLCEKCRRFSRHLERCQFCEYVSWRPSKIVRHLKTRHRLAEVGRDSRFKCQSCKYATADKSHFNRHLKTCGNFKYVSHKCESCGYTTNDKSNIKKHCKRFNHIFVSKK